MDQSWEKEGLFKNRPHATLIFERQMDSVFYWLGEWDQEEKCDFMEKILRACNCMIIRFLWTVLEPVVHRDFVYNQFEPLPESNFFTLSSYVTRELYARLEKIVNKYKRKKREVYRIPSSIVKNEDDVKLWTSESVLPVIKSYHDDGLASKCSLTKSKSHPTLVKSMASLPNITSCRSMTSEKRLVGIKALNTMPLRHQAKQRHIQKEEAFSRNPILARKHVFTSCHERSHIKTSTKVRFNSAMERYEVEAKDWHPTKPRSLTSLGVISTGPGGKIGGSRCGSKQLVDWFQDKWNDWQRKEFLQMFLQTLNTTQIYLLYGLIMVRLYRDFISSLPRHLSVKILSYLSPEDLIQVAKVSRIWEELASSDEIWEQKCRARRVTYSTKTSWKEMFLKYESLDENWRRGRCTITEFIGHTASVTTVQFFKNLLASGSVDKTIKVWSLETGEILQTLKGHSKGVWGLRFMSKTLLISCSNDQTIKIWNLRTGKCARTFLGHVGGVWCIQQKGDLLVSGSVDKTARLWNLRHCRLKGVFAGHAGAILGIDLDPDRGVVFTGSADKTVRMWNMATAECIKCILVSTNNFPVTCIGYCQGLLACCFGNTIALLDIETWETITTLEGHKERIEALQFSLKNTNQNEAILTVVSCSRDGKTKCWDALKGTCISSFRAHEDAITSLAFDETKIVTSSQDCVVKLWNYLS